MRHLARAAARPLGLVNLPGCRGIHVLGRPAAQPPAQRAGPYATMPNIGDLLALSSGECQAPFQCRAARTGRHPPAGCSWHLTFAFVTGGCGHTIRPTKKGGLRCLVELHLVS